MRNSTFVALLLAGYSLTASAELMDKYFYKIATDKMDANWVIQDAGNTVMTPGKENLTVTNNKNGGRMLNYFWNENAWTKVTDLSTLPNSTYKFSMDLNMSNMAARSDMEFVLLPVNACTSTDTRVSTHNYHWWNSADGEDYFFRWRVVTAPTAANGDYTICINETPTGKSDWASYTETVELSSQKTYKYEVEINTAANTATYTISDEEGTQVKTGTHNYTCTEERAGIFVFGMNGTSTHLLSNIGLSYKAEGPFANEPDVELTSVIGAERYYYATFQEGETLHWKQLGDAEDPISGASYISGDECSVDYSSASDNTNFESGEDYVGHKLIPCTQSGDLVVWTTRDDNEARSEDVVMSVTCESVSMPTPVATITNVSTGYSKQYTITADNTNTLLKPEVTISWKYYNEDGSLANSNAEAKSGDVINVPASGKLVMYAYDGTHPTQWYSQSEEVTVENNTSYEEAETKDFAWSKDKCNGSVEGFTKTEIVDNANKSHWDRIYSDQMYGYDENGNATACTEADAASYKSIKKGFGFYAGTAIGTDDAKWNVQTPEDPTTAFAPLTPTADFLGNSKYVASAWGVFPLEGIVYYDTNLTNAEFELDSKYTSDDANKPNFYIVHTRGGYDRPDKGDCNKTTVVKAGEKFNLYRYDTAICDVKVMTYQGFVPGTGITSIDAEEAKASTAAVKKVVTSNGIVLVKGDKIYSVSGAQIK